MACPRCDWPMSEARLLSTHHTSEGVVRYLRCPCGQVTIQTLRFQEPAYPSASSTRVRAANPVAPTATSS